MVWEYHVLSEGHPSLTSTVLACFDPWGPCAFACNDATALRYWVCYISSLWMEEMTCSGCVGGRPAAGSALAVQLGRGAHGRRLARRGGDVRSVRYAHARGSYADPQEGGANGQERAAAAGVAARRVPTVWRRAWSHVQAPDPAAALASQPLTPPAQRSLLLSFRRVWGVSEPTGDRLLQLMILVRQDGACQRLPVSIATLVLALLTCLCITVSYICQLATAVTNLLTSGLI